MQHVLMEGNNIGKKVETDKIDVVQCERCNLKK